jgi:hypothetical protein
MLVERRGSFPLSATWLDAGVTMRWHATDSGPQERGSPSVDCSIHMTKRV